TPLSTSVPRGHSKTSGSIPVAGRFVKPREGIPTSSDRVRGYTAPKRCELINIGERRKVHGVVKKSPLLCQLPGSSGPTGGRRRTRRHGQHGTAPVPRPDSPSGLPLPLASLHYPSTRS